jgi:monoamine oxidase
VHEADVAIVGAGLAGLTCARRLIEGGASVCVIEADTRVGGRILGRDVDGHAFDLGGQWIGPGQHRVRALVSELGLRTFPTFHQGEHVIDAGGVVRRFRGTIPWLGPRALAELGITIARTYAESWRISPERPLDGFARLDARSVEAICGSLGPVARGAFDAAFRTVLGAEAGEVSLLWYLFYARAGGGFFRLVDVHGGAQEQRIVEGAHAMATALAERLGERVLLGLPVARIEQSAMEVRISCGAQRDVEVRAKRVVVAVPISKVNAIEFDPELPAARRQLADRARMGATVKVLALYPKPFWRERGLSGQAVGGAGPMSVLFDNTTHDGRQPALVGFVVGEAARSWSTRSPDERRRALVDQLVRWLGTAAGEPSHLETHDWSTEPWVGGCPVASPPPGVLAARAWSLREPLGRVHWAGTETSTTNPGYLDGAVSSAERAATEVLRSL